MRFNRFSQLNIFALALLLNSCSSIDSTLDSISESVSTAGDYIYDSVNFWEDDEPEQSEAIIIEEAVEVPEYAIPEQNFGNDLPQQQNFSQNIPMQPYYDPIYRSQRQYYFVGPNGTPMLAPPPPPFPQYSIDQVAPVLPYSYNNNLNYAPMPMQQESPRTFKKVEVPSSKEAPRMMSEEEEMELFGIQNNCIRVVKDYVNGGYSCDDFD